MTAPSDGFGIGVRLAGARTRAGLTIIQAAERLHVDPWVIEALEAERFDELGASVYVRGHIRHYAELVGEAPAELQGLYAASAHAAIAPDLTRGPKAQSDAHGSRLLLAPAVIVVAAVAVIGTIWWVAGTLRAQRMGLAPAWRRPPSAAGPASASLPVHAGAGTATPHHPPGERAHGRADAALSPPAPTAASAAETTTPRSAAPAPTKSSRRVPEANTKPAALSIHFAEDSWAEVYDARGERLLYDVASAGSTRTVSGAPPLRVVLGNPAGVSLQLDGRTVSVPGAERNVSVEFQILRSGRAAPSRLASAGEQRAGGAGAAPAPAATSGAQASGAATSDAPAP